MFLQSLNDLLHTVVDRPGLGVDHQLGAVRLLVGLVDPSEALDDAGPGLLVEPLHVPLLALLQAGGHVDLVKGQAVLFVELPGEVAVLLERRHEGAESHYPTVSEQLAHLGHTPDVQIAMNYFQFTIYNEIFSPDVLLAILGREPEVLI